MATISKKYFNDLKKGLCKTHSIAIAELVSEYTGKPYTEYLSDKRIVSDAFSEYRKKHKGIKRRG